MRRGFPITFEMRGERRKRAEARQAEYDKLSLQEKLDKIPAGGGKKERAKLEALLHKQSTVHKVVEKIEHAAEAVVGAVDKLIHPKKSKQSK